MPRLVHAVPKYREHKPSGQAVVTIAGRDHYLGPYGTKASQLEYDRRIGEWLAAGRPSTPMEEAGEITVTELVAAFWNHAQIHYRKNGSPTGTAENYKKALGLVRSMYGHTLVRDFRPRSLEAIQLAMIAEGQSRRYINDNISRIRKVFRWGVAKEMVPPEVVQRLDAVPNLAKGRSEARETEPIPPYRKRR